MFGIFQIDLAQIGYDSVHDILCLRGSVLKILPLNKLILKYLPYRYPVIGDRFQHLPHAVCVAHKCILLQTALRN